MIKSFTCHKKLPSFHQSQSIITLYTGTKLQTTTPNNTSRNVLDHPRNNSHTSNKAIQPSILPPPPTPHSLPVALRGSAGQRYSACRGREVGCPASPPRYSPPTTRQLARVKEAHAVFTHHRSTLRQFPDPLSVQHRITTQTKTPYPLSVNSLPNFAFKQYQDKVSSTELLQVRK